MAHSFRRETLKRWQRGVAFVLLAVMAAGVAVPAVAQQWRWPWETDTERQPRRRPAPRPQPGNENQPSYQSRSQICLDLERRLANLINRGKTGTADPEAQLRAEAATQRRAVRSLDAKLERGDCWEQFFFQRSLRNTRTCRKLYRDREVARRAYESARSQLDGYNSRNTSAQRDELLRALAYNRCGSAYTQEARRRENNSLSNFFSEEDNSYSARDGNTFQGLPFATYRTLCVRLCDGYYFPISFSTLPNYFARDAEVCRNRCAAPTALYYHQNPGGSIDQMVSVDGSIPYKKLKTAFAYRKTFTKGCSCKRSEYAENGSSPQTDGTEKKAEVPKRGALSPVR